MYLSDILHSGVATLILEIRYVFLTIEPACHETSRRIIAGNRPLKFLGGHNNEQFNDTRE